MFNQPVESARELLTRYQAGERDFKGAYLEGVNLRHTCLVGANLIGAKLQQASLSGANLQHAI